MIVEALGSITACLTTAAFLPQVIKIHKTKKTQDLSLVTYVLFCLGLILWLIYGWFLKSTPLIASNVITLVLAGYTLLLKVRHG